MSTATASMLQLHASPSLLRLTQTTHRSFPQKAAFTLPPFSVRPLPRLSRTRAASAAAPEPSVRIEAPRSTDKASPASLTEDEMEVDLLEHLDSGVSLGIAGLLNKMGMSMWVALVFGLALKMYMLAKKEFDTKAAVEKERAMQKKAMSKNVERLTKMTQEITNNNSQKLMIMAIEMMNQNSLMKKELMDSTSEELIKNQLNEMNQLMNKNSEMLLKMTKQMMSKNSEKVVGITHDFMKKNSEHLIKMIKEDLVEKSSEELMKIMNDQ